MILQDCPAARDMRGRDDLWLTEVCGVVDSRRGLLPVKPLETARMLASALSA